MITSVLQSLSVPGLAPETRSAVQPSGNRTDTSASQTAKADKKASATGNTRELSDEEQKQTQDMERIDRHVRAHEAAHQGAAGGLARGKSFTYQQGPDGKQYAVAGEVQIDMSAVSGDPRATIAKMQKVRTAALSPSDPSPQDRQVAAQAARTEAQARTELLEQQQITGTTQSQDDTEQAERSQREKDEPNTTERTSSNNPSTTAVQRFALPSFSGTIFNSRA